MNRKPRTNAASPAIDYKNAWGVPNWRDGALYPDPAYTTERQWWWEFLRRRDDYRMEWSATYDEAQAHFDEIRVGMDSKHREHLRASGLYKLEYRTRFNIWGSMLAPSVLAPPADFSPRRPGLYHAQYADHDERARSEEAGEISLSFDVHKPIPEQLARAEKYLTALQREYLGGEIHVRHHMAKWPLYLRVIDAHDANETWNRICRALLVDDRGAGVDSDDVDQRAAAAAKARQVWEQARELMFKLTA